VESATVVCRIRLLCLLQFPSTRQTAVAVDMLRPELVIVFARAAPPETSGQMAAILETYLFDAHFYPFFMLIIGIKGRREQ
jgi:hypothetical protein